METRDYSEDLKSIILDMTQEELRNSTNNKGALKYIESKISSSIDELINELKDEESCFQVYKKVIKTGACQDNINDIGKLIKSEELFKSKNELIKLAKYLKLEIKTKQSYRIILKKITNHIYINKDYYDKKFVYYTRGEQAYILEPEIIKEQLIEEYKSRARNDMRSIAKILNIDTSESDGAEEIRRKVINCIIKDKLGKIKN